MTNLIAIAHPDTTTASAAMDEVHRLQKDLVIQADAVVTIMCDEDGKYKPTTNDRSVERGAMWGIVLGATFRHSVLHPGPRYSGRRRIRNALRHDRAVRHQQRIPQPGPRAAQAGDLGAVQGRGESDPNQGHRGAQ